MIRMIVTLAVLAFLMTAGTAGGQAHVKLQRPRPHTTSRPFARTIRERYG